MKYLVTAALPYANGELHLGHPRSTYVPADVYSRYLKLKGEDCLFVCATDEHGTPIEINAEKQRLSPEEFVKQFRSSHKRDFKRLGVEFDEFYYTESPENHALAGEFFLKLKEKGLIYEKKIEQLFDEKANRVLPDRYVRGECPNCHAQDQYGDACEKCSSIYSPKDLIKPYSVITKTTPVKHESVHYFFALSKCSDFLTNYLETSTLQSDVVNYLKNWISKGLEDWDITRDGPYFGIKIPGEEEKYFYVWFDAPIGYVSSTKHYCDAKGIRWEDYWKNDKNQLIHFIGKDIQYFHYLFWPAMLENAGFAKPNRIPTRGYLNLENEKMGKSRGNYILLSQFLNEFPADYLRYYLTAITPNNTSDGNFLWKEFQAKVNSELIDNYGNYCYRVLSFIYNKAGASITEVGDYSPEDEAFKKRIDEIAGEVEKDLNEIELKRALEKIISFSSEANKYFNDSAPWVLMKNKDKRLKTVLFLSAKAALALTTLLNPFVPFTTKKIALQLNCELKWNDYSGVKAGLQLNQPEIVLQKIEDEVIKAKTSQ
ncbi:methionine--tRNA ligase [Candidatus Micrarchaeota archaeon]|nr:methionine--tRNA ligase [Candidatus Micrarchaeota archaeon]